MDVLGLDDATEEYSAELVGVVKRLFELQKRQLREIHDLQVKALEQGEGWKLAPAYAKDPMKSNSVLGLRNTLSQHVSRLRDAEHRTVEDVVLGGERVARLRGLREIADVPQKPFASPHLWDGYRVLEEYEPRPKKRRTEGDGSKKK